MRSWTVLDIRGKICRLRSNDIFSNYIMKSDQEKKSVDKSGEWRFFPLNFKIANILCRLILFCLKEYQNALGLIPNFGAAGPALFYIKIYYFVPTA